MSYEKNFLSAKNKNNDFIQKVFSPSQGGAILKSIIMHAGLSCK